MLQLANQRGDLAVHLSRMMGGLGMAGCFRRAAMGRLTRDTQLPLTRDTQVRASARACAHLLADPHSPGNEMKRHRQERQICYQIFYQHKTSVGNSGNGNARGGWHSRREPGRVAREERRLAHIVEPEE